MIHIEIFNYYFFISFYQLNSYILATHTHSHTTLLLISVLLPRTFSVSHHTLLHHSISRLLISPPSFYLISSNIRHVEPIQTKFKRRLKEHGEPLIKLSTPLAERHNILDQMDADAKHIHLRCDNMGWRTHLLPIHKPAIRFPAIDKLLRIPSPTHLMLLAIERPIGFLLRRRRYPQLLHD